MSALLLALGAAGLAIPAGASFRATTANQASSRALGPPLTTTAAPTLRAAGLLVEDYASAFTTPAGAAVRATVGALAPCRSGRWSSTVRSRPPGTRA